MIKKIYILVIVCCVALVSVIYVTATGSRDSLIEPSVGADTELKDPVQVNSSSDTSSDQAEEGTPPRIEKNNFSDASLVDDESSQDQSSLDYADQQNQMDPVSLSDVPESVVTESVDKKSKSSMVSNESNNIITFTLLASLIVNALLALTAFYLFKWRKLVVNDEKTLMPEHWVGAICSDVGVLGKAVSQLVNTSASNSKKLSELGEILDTVYRSLDEKDREIKRYKQGYDTQIYKRFVRKFILITVSLKELLHKDELSKADLETIHFRLEDALEDCGIEIRDVEVGSDYRELGDLVEDNPQSCPADDAGQHFKVAELIRSAYVIVTGDSHHVIIPAKVKIFTQS